MRPSHERTIAACLVVSIVAALALAVVYATGGQPQAEGIAIFFALGGLGSALVLWARHLLPAGPEVQARSPLGSSGEQVSGFEEALDRDQVLERRTLLRRLLVATFVAFGAAAVFPLWSLGPDPDDALKVTPWATNRRVVNSDGRPIRPTDVPVDALVTVFPEGNVDAADGQAVLLRVSGGQLRPRPERATWSPDGIIAYSKVCTHAGCPVGLYQTETHALLCPCHQSNFDVLDEGRPIAGPAARALPQLPLVVGPDGYLWAQGDFSEPVGPAWWDRDR
jgi:ubiquinol-cytochrome c reductase iron-sulfur subunit